MPPRDREVGTPTPKIRGNLPTIDESRSDERGQELPPRPVEWYERSDPRGTMGSVRLTPWEPPKEALGSGRGMTAEQIANLHRQNPQHYAHPDSYTADPLSETAMSYSRGGAVKHGSPTRVACSNNKIVR